MFDKVVSKGLVIHGATDTQIHPTKSLTFSVPVSSEMAPTFKLVAMIVNPIGELVADSVTIPVKSFNRYKVIKSDDFTLNIDFVSFELDFFR